MYAVVCNYIKFDYNHWRHHCTHGIKPGKFEKMNLTLAPVCITERGSIHILTERCHYPERCEAPFLSIKSKPVRAILLICRL